MGTTKKQEVAELLYNLPTNQISNDTIKFIMSNLPDTNVKGDFKLETSTFDHSKNETHEALGFNVQKIADLSKKINEIHNQCVENDTKKKSQFIEALLPVLKPEEISLLVCLSVETFQSYSSDCLLDKGRKDLWMEVHGVNMSQEEQKKFLALEEIKKTMMKLKGLMGRKGDEDGL